MSDTEATGSESVESKTEDTETLTETEGGSEQETKKEETKEKKLRDEEGWPVWLGQSPKRHKRNEAFKDHDTMGDFQDHHLKVVTERDEAIKTRDEAVKAKDESVKAQEGTIKVPTDESSEEEINEFYKGLGRPDKAEDYKFEDPALPEGIKLDEELVKQSKSWFFEGAATTAQAQLFFEKFVQYTLGKLKTQAEAEEQSITDATEKLRTEVWKTEQEFKENLELVNRTAKVFGGEEFLKLLDEVEIKGVKLGNHPVFLKAMATIGAAMGEDKFIEGETTPGEGGEDTEEGKLKERYKDSMGKDGVPYRQDILPKTEDSESEKELKKRYPKMEITS